MIYLATFLSLLSFLFICLTVYNKGKKKNDLVPVKEVKTISEPKTIKPIEKLKKVYKPKSMGDLEKKLYKIKPDLTFWFRNFPVDFLIDMVKNFDNIPMLNEFDPVVYYSNYGKNRSMVLRLKNRV